MASVYRSRRDERPGGKIVRGRQTAAARSKTPYDRPAPAAAGIAPPQNPNWLTGVVYPTSRMIATGATKIFTYVFAPESSSSSSSSGTDSSPEDGMDDGADDYDVPYDNGGSLNENGTASELIECFRPEPQLTVGKSDIKRLIEKLLMQVTFSREECDRLTKIIKSRVIDGSTMEEEKDEKLGGIPHRTVGDVTPELCSKAVMEAKQWLEEKKVASSSKSEMDRGTGTLSSVPLSQERPFEVLVVSETVLSIKGNQAPELVYFLSQDFMIVGVTKGEPVSPVDIAKVYMRARPSWSSSINCVESGTPSPIGREFFKDKTPYSVAGNSYSSSKKMYSLSSGSWNIQEEIRRVHSKATEDMLKTVSSTRIDLPSFARERKRLDKPLLADKKDWEGGDRGHNSNMFPVTGSPASELELTCNISREEDFLLQPTILSSAQNQDLEGIQPVEGDRHAGSNSRHPTSADLAIEHDSRTYSSDKEEAELIGNPNTNGFPISGSSFGAGDDEQNLRPSDDEGPKAVGSNLDKLVNSVPMEETCELLSEASMEVPVMNETNGSAAVDGSQDSCTMQYEELSPEPEDSLVGKTSTVVEKRQGRKVSSRYNRKGRGKR